MIHFFKITCLSLLLFASGAYAAQAETRLLMLGDSITAGYGLPNDQALPVQLENALDDPNIRVINAGVSGDTTAGGQARLDWLLADNPHAVIVALGGNDTLRGLNPAASAENLAKILKKLQDKNIPALLAVMQAPRNMGAEYTQRFDAIFPALAEEFSVLFYPFLLQGVATDPTLNQPDGIHPNPAGVGRIVTGILPLVQELLQQ